MAQCSHIDCSSQRAKVVMIADTLEFATPAIQEKSFFRNEFNAPDSETRFVPVFQFIPHADLSHRPVKGRRFRRPEGGILNQEILDEGRADGLSATLTHAVPFRREDSCKKLDFTSLCKSFDRGFKTDGSILAAYGRSGDKCAPDRDMDWIHGQKMHVPVESCPGIPSRGLGFVLQAYRQDVSLPVLIQDIGHVTVECVIAVRPEADLTSVHKNLCLTHCTVKNQNGALARGDIENAAVPARANVRKTSGTACLPSLHFFKILGDGDFLKVNVSVERSFDSPVVRDGHTLPGRIVKENLTGSFCIRIEKSPSLFQKCLLSGRLRGQIFLRLRKRSGRYG